MQPGLAPQPSIAIALFLILRETVIQLAQADAKLKGGCGTIAVVQPQHLYDLLSLRFRERGGSGSIGLFVDVI